MQYKYKLGISIMKVQERIDWVVITFIVAVIIGFNVFGFLGSIIVLIIGLPMLGWKNRHKGPFSTNKQNAKR